MIKNAALTIVWIVLQHVNTLIIKKKKEKQNHCPSEYKHDHHVIHVGVLQHTVKVVKYSRV